MIRENLENIRNMLKYRDVKFDLDLLLELDKKRREMIITLMNLERKKMKCLLKSQRQKKQVVTQHQ